MRLRDILSMALVLTHLAAGAVQASSGARSGRCWRAGACTTTWCARRCAAASGCCWRALRPAR